MYKAIISLLLTGAILILSPEMAGACSTFKLQKGGALIYAHNLDQPERAMPGMAFINNRGVFKTGHSFSEMFLDEARRETSDLCWISRFGSVTFSIYGRDFPDGGINEAGIFIWEMGMVGTQYPADPKLPRLLKMNWMQYVLDCFGTLDGALTAAHDVHLEGWQWHFFLGDSQGNCAIVEFIDGEVVVHRGDALLVPALFNQPYDRELEYLSLFQGFGGQYEVDFSLRFDSRVPRFVKAAAMLRSFDPTRHNALEYSKSLLHEVGNKPYKWGVLVDVINGIVHFNTESNPEWKHFSYRDLDFSNQGPTLTLNIDQVEGGDVIDRFQPLQDEEYRSVFKEYVDDMSASSFNYFGVSRETLVERFATAYHDAERAEGQYFEGVWTGQARKADDEGHKEPVTVTLLADSSNVTGSIDFRGEVCELQHIRLVDRDIEFTFRDKEGFVFYPKGHLNGSSLDLEIERITGTVGGFLLQRR